MRCPTSAYMGSWHHIQLHDRRCPTPMIPVQGKVQPQAVPALDHFRDFGPSPNRPGNVVVQ
eukprot:CAMPEP_0172700342 /NCGR_PEP_ID=MMETSP1074-20121228/30845_1 /TAXON_ID=2916 /ORGANISM="Ceratium fusus, Strain PA161109" /LENGTH=60 /DNA_ID=CAMNT_0013521705 /DNA_START=228 /DNA_END=410 /DNA_ORIENTATION=-